MVTYLTRHMQVLFSTLGAMRRTPMVSINTVLIVAIALLLPTLLFIGVKSAQDLSESWQGRPQISIFLLDRLSDAEASLIYEELRLHPSVELAELITAEQALAEFRTLSGLDKELDFIDTNPLPRSIVVMPTIENATAERLLDLQAQLDKIDGIEDIRLDLDWTDRFNAMLGVVTRIALILSGLLAFGLLLIVGNTIKLLILNRRQEIEITKLVGGTDSFVRRPFLYYGSFYGIFGALVTLCLLLGAKLLVQEPMAELSQLYGKDHLLYRLNFLEIGAILLAGTVIGWLAARWSVARHLREIQPK